MRPIPQSVVSVATTDATESSAQTAADTTLGSTTGGTDLSSLMGASSLSNSTTSIQDHDDQVDMFKRFPDMLLEIVTNLVLQRGRSVALDQTGQLWSAVVLELISRPGAVIVGSGGDVSDTGDPRRAIARRGPRAARGLRRLTQANGLIDGRDSELENALIQAASGYLQQHDHHVQSVVVMEWATQLARQAWLRYMSRQQPQGGDGYRREPEGRQMADTSLPDRRIQHQQRLPNGQIKQQEQQQQLKPDEGYFSEEDPDGDSAADEELYGYDD